MATTIEIATQFSPYPAGRYRSDGPNSGERFREDFLLPALRTGEPVRVVLAGSATYGSSFLEESFGGLVRLGYFTPQELAARLTVVSGEAKYEIYRKRIAEYIARAEKLRA